MNAVQRLVLAGLAAVAVACGGDGSEGVDAAPMTSVTLGASGGTLTIPNGPTLTVPAGALAQTVTISITQTAAREPAGVTNVFLFEPAGLVFTMPATVAFPVPAGVTGMRVYWSKAGGAPGYDMLPTTQNGAVASAQISHFSNGYAGPVTGVGAHHTYVISRLGLPTTNTQAREFGLDLNGDQTVDNQLGMVFSTLGSMGFELQATSDQAVDSGLALTLADLQTDDYNAGQMAGFRTYIGTMPQPAPCSGASDTVCRKHLTGSATFDVAADNPINAHLLGNFVSGTMVTAPGGHAVVQMAMNPSRAMTLDLIGARAKIIGASASGIGGTSVLAGALTVAEVDATIIPEFAFTANDAIMRDCTMLSSPPACGCATDSTGKTMVGLFDTDQNCSVSLTEVKNNSLIVSLFAPDVTIDGQQALSVGFSITAVPGTFAP